MFKEAIDLINDFIHNAWTVPHLEILQLKLRVEEARRIAKIQYWQTKVCMDGSVPAYVCEKIGKWKADLAENAVLQEEVKRKLEKAKT